MTRKELRQCARTALAGKWGLAVGVTLVAILLGGVNSGVSIELSNETEQIISTEMVLEMLPFLAAGSAAVIAVAIFLSNVVALGYDHFVLGLVDNREVGMADLFSRFRNGNYMPAVKLQAFRGLLVFAWSLLFVIPGIIAGYSYSMATYIHLDYPELSAGECLRASRRLMDGRKMDLFVLQLSFFGWALLTALTGGIGNLFLTPYEKTTEARFYREITQGILITDYL